MANFFKANKKAQSSGKQVIVKIDKLDHNGQGVGYIQGKPVFVPASLPGEVIEAKLVESKSKYSRAQITSIKEQSAYRVEAACRHFYQCGGCDLQHIDYAEQLSIKQNKIVELFGRSDINQPLPWQAPIESQPYHYRRKARIGVQYDKKGDAIIGFRKSATNQLVSIKHCETLAESFQNIFVILKSVLAELSLYKSVGHVEVIATDKLTLVVRQLQTISAKDKKCWQKYALEHNWQVFIDDGNEIKAITEAVPLSYQLADNTLIHFQVSDFIQVNDAVNQQMISTALEWLSLTENDRVLDLFCGLGNFSLPMAKKVKQLVGIEGVQAMVERSTLNAENNKLKNCQFYQADLNAPWLDNHWAQQSFTHVVLDPARAGAFEAIDQIVQLKAKTILYVSCDPQTLARDSKSLVSHGYKIEKIMLMDMFSQTKHVETMVLFTLH